MIPLSDFDYICHDTIHNHPKNNAKLSSSYLYFLMGFGCDKHFLSLYTNK